MHLFNQFRDQGTNQRQLSSPGGNSTSDDEFDDDVGMIQQHDPGRSQPLAAPLAAAPPVAASVTGAEERPPPPAVVAAAPPGGPSTSDEAAGEEPPILTENAMDRMLAQELNQLSLKVREEISNEIHGVETLAVPESPELLTRKLAEMDQALLLHHNRERSSDGATVHRSNQASARNSNSSDDAYNEALVLGSRYIHDPALRLMFLRSEIFDGTKAAARFVNFLQLLREYLGPQALIHKPWTLSNFTAAELGIFKRGNFQICGRDRVGRLMPCLNGEFGNDPCLTTTVSS